MPRGHVPADFFDKLLIGLAAEVSPPLRYFFSKFILNSLEDKTIFDTQQKLIFKKRRC